MGRPQRAGRNGGLRGEGPVCLVPPPARRDVCDSGTLPPGRPPSPQVTAKVFEAIKAAAAAPEFGRREAFAAVVGAADRMADIKLKVGMSHSCSCMRACRPGAGGGPPAAEGPRNLAAALRLALRDGAPPQGRAGLPERCLPAVAPVFQGPASEMLLAASEAVGPAFVAACLHRRAAAHKNPKVRLSQPSVLAQACGCSRHQGPPPQRRHAQLRAPTRLV